MFKRNRSSSYASTSQTIICRFFFRYFSSLSFLLENRISIKYNNDDRDNHKRSKKNPCACLMYDFSAVDVDKLEGMKKNGLRPFFSLFLILFVSTIVACFRYCLQTMLYIVAIDKSRQTNRHHGYILYIYVNPVVNFRCAYTNVLLYLHSCVLLLKQE